jgi:hypothetical protein
VAPHLADTPIFLAKISPHQLPIPVAALFAVYPKNVNQSSNQLRNFSDKKDINVYNPDQPLIYCFQKPTPLN